MLKNKFGMFKVLALALSVLMLVSLAACGNDGMDDAAIQDAINAAVQSQSAANAAEQEKVAASLKAEQEKAESERLAAEESLKAANEAAEKAAKEAADKAAAAEKAAADAKKEAEAKAAEASKQAAEASKQAAEASKQASSLAQSAAQASKDALTATTTTAAPIAGEDLTAIKAKFATLKHKYTNPLGYGNYYLEADYEYIVLLFEKAAVELQNAMTVAAAESIYATLETEAAAVKNIKLAADQFAALVADLGDVEADVFTTAVEKKEAAEQALAELYCDFQGYFVSKVNADLEPHDVNVYADAYAKSWKSNISVELGLDDSFAELKKADTKIKVLTTYIAGYLTAKMETLYNKYELDFDDEGADLNDKIGAESVSDIIAAAYYEYLLISKVNGGDVAEADLEIEWDYLYNEETGKVVKDNAGNKVLDKTAPIAWFTVEEFVEIYVTPYLNSALEETKEAAINALYAALTVGRGVTTPATIYTSIVDANNAYLVSFKDVEDAMEEIAETFEAEIEDVTFVGDYKGNVSLADAQIDIWTKYVDAYIAAANTLIEGTKETAAEIYGEEYADKLEALYEQYEDRDDESSKSALAQKIANLDAKKAAFEANLEAATAYTFADFLSIELVKKYDKTNYEADKANYDVLNYITENGVNNALTTYINKVFAAALKASVGTSASTQVGMLGDLAYLYIEDLMALRDRLDPTLDVEDSLYVAAVRGNEITYVNGEDYKFGKYYSNTAVFEGFVAAVDKAIADIQAVSVEDYKDKNIQVKTPDSSTFHSDNKKKNLYWVNAEAKAWFYENYEAGDVDFTWLINQEKDGGVGLTINENSKTGDFLTLNNTGLPVQIVQTAEQQAMLAAQSLYEAVYTEINKTMITLEKNYLTAATGAITGSNGFKAIKANVKNSAELTAEVDAYAKVFTDKMTSVAGELKWSFSNDTFTKRVSTSAYINAIDNGSIFKFTDSAVSNAANYTYNGLEEDLTGYVNNFNATFFVDKTMASQKTGVESNVVLLYYYKLNAVEFITDTIEGYKNTYYTVTNNNNGILTTESVQVPGNGYEYDKNATKASAAGKAYEAQLDALLESYIAKINAVALNTRVEIKDNAGNVILAKVAQDWEWKLDPAKVTVNAYVVDLLGYAKAEAGNYTNGVNDLYDDATKALGGDSRVYPAFRTYYQQDYTGYTPALKPKAE